MTMIELDFLFVYEHKVRELENLCLMKYELDKRGYKSKIVYIEDPDNALAPKPIYHAKVLCMMACYNNHTLRWHTKDYVKFDKIIDLQWENIVYPKDEEREGAFKNYTEIGKDVVRVSWGKQNVKRLLEAAHMDPQKVKLIGHVGMDFLREPLCKYYYTREELFSKYKIPLKSKVILFASPYYGDSLSQEYINDMCTRFGDDWTDYYQFMCDSQHIVLEWIENICRNNADIVFIFRPHPGHPSKMAQDIEHRYDNFRIIGDESVKQWILTCDEVYTGNSSVVVEAYFAHKMCQLVFPLSTPQGYELKLIADSKKLTSYEEFEKSLFETQKTFPTPKESIEEIYLVDWETPSYIKFANMAEQVIKDDYYLLPKTELKSYKNYDIGTKIIKCLCKIERLYKIYLKLLNDDRIKWDFLKKQRALREKVYITARNNRHESTNNEEISEIIERIGKAINSSVE